MHRRSLRYWIVDVIFKFLPLVIKILHVELKIQAIILRNFLRGEQNTIEAIFACC